jgi:threonyl-tRNA synthetase
MAAGEAREIEIELPDGDRRKVRAGTPAVELLANWRPGEAASYLAARLGGRAIDLGAPLGEPGALAPLTFQDRAGRETLHHSAAHVVAKALMRVVPEAKPTNGPGTEEGFYYDFDVRPLTPEDIERVRAEVRRIVASDEPFRRRILDREAALALFAKNPHKQGYIRDAPPDEPISVYDTGDWTDLCRGPHVPSTRWLGGLEILGFSAVSQGGDPQGLPLQRVRGVAFPTRPELEQYLAQRKEAGARDHRVLGRQLELFDFIEEAPGLPFWLPKGMIVVRELERFVGEYQLAAGYQEIRTPLLYAQSLYETSGHWEHYREDMFLTAIDDRVYCVKPMNCPGAMMVFRSRSRSYRELPLRLSEWAPLHRLEASGTIHGLTRVREFVQDDAHIFLTEEQVEEEVRELFRWIERAFSTFELTWHVELSTRPERALGDVAQWDRAERTLRRVLDESKAAYRVTPGEGAFYGPKIDIHIRDQIGRSWQTGTIQLDYQQPARFGLQYQGADGVLHTPVVVHRTIIGSFERFVGVLLEHCAGRLPPWLAPTQVRILPVADRHLEAARALAEELRRAGLRADASDAQDTLSKRIRASELEKVPYVGVIGDAEVEARTVTLRTHGEKVPKKLARAELAELLLSRIKSRSYRP